MSVARILTPMQVMMLREAATKEARKEATELIKQQSPGLFFHDTKDNKPDPALRDRVFYDEPRNLDAADYKKHIVPYAGINQAKIFRARGEG